MQQGQLFINGQWCQGEGPSLQSIHPATGEVVWSGQMANSEQLKASVSAAREAFPAWSNLSVSKRHTYLEAFADQLKQAQDKLATVIAQDAGKPLWEARQEVQAMINKVAISSEAYQQRSGETTSQLDKARAMTRHKAHGVIAVLGPFNFPAHLPNGHIIPALLAGNTIVFKPSRHTPWVAQCMLHYWEQAGLPHGVLNLVHGDRQCVEGLLNMDIDGVFFTGSYQTGSSIHKQFAGHVEKLLVLEMGGNNPLIIGAVKDKEIAAYYTIVSAFITAGQRCTCARRLLVPDGSAGDEFLASLLHMMHHLKIGLPNDEPQPFISAVISKQQAEFLLDTEQQWQQQGAVSLLPMRHLQPETGLISPGLIDVSHVIQAEDVECFGPLLRVQRYSTLAEALMMANDTRYGLSAGLLSDDDAQYQYFLQHIRAGIVNWNRPLTGALSTQPFGGIGYSGNYHPSAYYAADYCAYPIASIESEQLNWPSKPCPGIIEVNERR